MERTKSIIEKALLFFLPMGFLISFFGIKVLKDFSLIIYLTPLVLILSFIFLMISEYLKDNLKVIFPALIIILICFLIEAVGVNTGLIFGRYSYSMSLGPMLFKTPLLIGVNWFIVVWGAYSLSQKIENVYARIFFSSVLAVLFDFILEKAAFMLSYWHWAGISVPIQNYLAWFLVSILVCSIFSIMKIKPFSKLGSVLYISQLIFFIALVIKP